MKRLKLFDFMHNGVGSFHKKDGKVKRAPSQMSLVNNFLYFSNTLHPLFTFIVAETVN